MSEIRNRKGRNSNKNNTKKQLKNYTKEAEDGVNEGLYARDKRTLAITARVVIISSCIVLILYSTNTNSAHPFATWSDDVSEGKEQSVQCSNEYISEVVKFKGCVPHACKRIVTDKVIPEADVEALLDLVKTGLQLGGSDGGASILDLHSGALSHGNHFINIYHKKEAKELLTPLHFKAFKMAKQKIKQVVAQYFKVKPEKIYLTHPTFFSELTAKDPVTVHDEYWHPHVDKDTYKSFHFTTLLYLNDYGIDFEGGKFVFSDNWVNSTIEPRKGRVIIFTSGKENVHYVERVKKGVRYAMTISFTCDKQYAINDPDIRKLN